MWFQIKNTPTSGKVVVFATSLFLQLNLILLQPELTTCSSLEQQQDSNNFNIQTSTTSKNEDLDNSIPKLQADVLELTNTRVSSVNLLEQQVVDNGNPRDDQVVALSKLERRLDALEFELRKSLHLNKLLSVNPTTAATEAQIQADNQATAILSERLELMEKFIATTTTKLYETEQRVKQLERCDCRLKCKWAHRPMDNNRTLVTLLKEDGEIWNDKCDVCSCHRGKVRCSHTSCPEPQCQEPRHEPGKCCPVCYKPCAYRGQMVRHGNKLVINSNQDTCKECLCYDGRLKCQRVESSEQTRRIQAATSGSMLSRPQRATPLELKSESGGESAGSKEEGSLLAEEQQQQQQQQQLGGALEDDSKLLEGEDYYWNNEVKQEETTATDIESNLVQLDKRGRKRLSRGLTSELASMKGTLVCPQIDCRIEEQLKFKNDCCSYCKTYDFCAFKSHCHPNANCINTIANLTNPNVNVDYKYSVYREESPHISSTFNCICKQGFSGDGRLICNDIDECSDQRSNDCDPKTTVCLNLPGSYECRCKRGFKQQLDNETTSQDNSLLDQAVVNENVTQTLVKTATPKWEPTNQQQQQQLRGIPKRCVDIDECSDGKLNRCHPQAKCLNTKGSYKCKCKRGYLGNGFECHKWFSSGPNVAAYLYRHSASTGTGESVFNSTSSFKVNMPLDSVVDDGHSDEDDSDRTGDQWTLHRGYEDDENTNDNDDQDDDDDETAEDEMNKNEADLRVPKLSESRWEPLRLETNSQQQTRQLNGINHLGISAQNLQSNEPNTRTMFFQPPRKPQNVTIIAEPKFQQDSNAVNGNGDTGKLNSRKNSDTNYPIYIQRSSETSQKSDEQANKQKGTSSSGQTSSLSGNTNNQELKAHRWANENGLGYKRGTIIASATLSPTKGQAAIVAQTSSLQHDRFPGSNSAASTATYFNRYQDNLMAHLFGHIQLVGLLSIIGGIYLSHINHLHHQVGLLYFP